MTPAIAAALKIAVDRIVQDVHPVRIVLFGSQARGDAGPDSDVDLLVILSEITERREQVVAIRRLLADMPFAKDVLVASPQEVEESRGRVDSIVWPAIEEGRILYEQSA